MTNFSPHSQKIREIASPHSVHSNSLCLGSTGLERGDDSTDVVSDAAADDDLVDDIRDDVDAGSELMTGEEVVVAGLVCLAGHRHPEALQRS